MKTTKRFKDMNKKQKLLFITEKILLGILICLVTLTIGLTVFSFVKDRQRKSTTAEEVTTKNATDKEVAMSEEKQKIGINENFELGKVYMIDMSKPWTVTAPSTGLETGTAYAVAIVNGFEYNNNTIQSGLPFGFQKINSTSGTVNWGVQAFFGSTPTTINIARVTAVRNTDDTITYTFNFIEGVEILLVFKSDGTQWGGETLYKELITEYTAEGASYDKGYMIGYGEGYNEGISKQVNPVTIMIASASAFLEAKLFGEFSIGMFFAAVLFVSIALIFLKTFAGG